MIVMMHFGSWANCSITTGYKFFPSLSQDCAFGQNVRPRVTLNYHSKKRKRKSLQLREYSSTHGLKLYVLSKVSMRMLKLCSVQGGGIKIAKIFDGIFLKGLSLAWEGWRKKSTFWRVEWIVADLQDVFAQEKRGGRNWCCYTIFISL